MNHGGTNIRLDVKDMEILRELDSNFRQNFSEIGKKVNLSKNSVSIRFEKLKEYSLHNMVGLNYELIKLSLVSVYYSFDYYDEKTEKEIIEEVKKLKNVQRVAKYFGIYDVVLGFLFNNFDDLAMQIDRFDERFAGRINKKEIIIFLKQYNYRYNFLHDKPLTWVSKVEKINKKVELTSTDRKILRAILLTPRLNIIDLAEKIGVTPKTASKRIKMLEKLGVIMGYFITIDPKRFGYDTYKLFVQLYKLKRSKEFEDYVSKLKNIKFFGKTLGSWDYEVDLIYPNMNVLQKEIDEMKIRLPGMIRRIEITSLGRRIFTNEKNLFI